MWSPAGAQAGAEGSGAGETGESRVHGADGRLPRPLDTAGLVSAGYVEPMGCHQWSSQEVHS